jgi:hypothetical protein
MFQDLTEVNAVRRLSISITYKIDKLKRHISKFIGQLDPDKRLQVMESDEWCDFLVQKRNLGQ